MNRTARSACLATAAVVALPLALAGCSDGGESQASSESTSSTSTPSSSSSSTTPSSSSSSTSSSSTTPSSSSSTTTSSSSSSSSSASTSSSKTLDNKLVASCVSATSKINGAIRQWNSAVRNDSSSQRDTAARRLGTTAGELRTLASGSKHAPYSTRTRTVASELDKMKKAHDGNKTVRSGDLNAAYRNLRTWCSDQIKA